jgi:hypothetical protein
MYVLLAVLPGPEKKAITATFAKNHGHFQSFHGQPSKNLPLHDNSKQNNNKKPKNIMIGGGILSFFISALHFWIKHYTNF